MKALVAHSYGPLETLTMSDLPIPRPGRGEVLLRTQATSLNGIDPKLVTGAMQDLVQVPHPFVPGVDVAGIVEEVGPGVTRFSVGDLALAALGPSSGGLAEYVVTQDTPRLAPRPDWLDAAHGAALISGAMTALTILDAAAIQSHETVLVVGATGGVGSFTVQLARRAARSVYATGHAVDEFFVRGLGADRLINYQTEEPARVVRRQVRDGVDVVLDLVKGGPDLAASAAAARPGGRLVSVLGGPPSFERGVAATYVVTQFPRGLLEETARQVVQGGLHVAIGATYPFAESRTALLDFTTRHVTGKYVVTF